jgi:hypothetical protein
VGQLDDPAALPTEKNSPVSIGLDDVEKIKILISPGLEL